MHKRPPKGAVGAGTYLRGVMSSCQVFASTCEVLDQSLKYGGSRESTSGSILISSSFDRLPCSSLKVVSSKFEDSGFILSISYEFEDSAFV